MKEKILRFRLHASRFDKLKLLAEKRQKTMTQLIEDWIDTLPKVEKVNMMEP